MAICALCRQVVCQCPTSPPATMMEPTGAPICEPQTLVGCLAPVPCPIDSCCNRFDNNNLVMSFGGPFPIPEPLILTVDGQPTCPPCPPGLLGECAGPLSDIICLQIPPGTYEIHFHAEVLGALSGFQLDALFLPDCSTTEGAVLIEEFVADAAADRIVIEGNLTVAVKDNCKPGLVLLVHQGCPFTPPAGGTIQNIQFKVLHLSSRNLIDCLGSPLVAAPTDITECIGAAAATVIDFCPRCADTICTPSPCPPPPSPQTLVCTLCPVPSAAPNIQVQFSGPVDLDVADVTVCAQPPIPGGCTQGCPPGATVISVTPGADNSFTIVTEVLCDNAIYQVTISGAVDCCGNVVPTFAWTFTTAAV